jgi:polyhydroxybutyrate depolymerase
MMQDWAVRNGCSPVSEVTFAQGDTTCETWPGCDGDVEVSLCTIEGAGHCWPGNASCLFGASTTELHASEVIGDMFLEHTLP